MNSAVYFGWVRHRRFKPLGHRFNYALYMTALDLDELADPSDRVLRSWARRFRRSDHFGDPNTPLKACVRALVTERLGREVEHVVLVTHLRHAGHVMNPVSFYYCFDGAARWTALVAEVHNTPWNETHTYVLPVENDRLDVTFDKEFHVSPFMGMAQRYRWRLGPLGDRLVVHMENFEGPDKVLDATMVLKRGRSPARDARLAAVRYPLVTLKVAAAIYGHALLLRLKRVPYHAHPSNLGRQQR